jgi:Mo-dependent nitrogenase C-terminus
MKTIPHGHNHRNYHPLNSQRIPSFDILYPLRRLLDKIEIKNAHLAHFLCQLIPCCCPFERDIKLLHRTFHIPPLCKLNPLYEEFVSLRFRALSYLADECGEDITKYIC